MNKAVVSLHNKKQTQKMDLKDKIELNEIPTRTKNALFNIYVSGFDHGVNEGSFPEHGTAEAFNRLLNNESPLQDGSSFGTDFKKIFASIACSEIANKEIESAEKKEAIGFAEWVNNLGYTQVGNSEWKSLSDKLGKTTEQLFTLYKNKSNNG